MSDVRHHIFAQFHSPRFSLEATQRKKEPYRTQGLVYAQGKFVRDPDMEAELQDSNGSAFLDMVFGASEDDVQIATLADLTGEGDSYEITLPFPFALMGWAERVLDECSDDVPLTLHAWLPEQQEKRTGLLPLVDAKGRITDVRLESVSIGPGRGTLIKDLIGQ